MGASTFPVVGSWSSPGHMVSMGHVTRRRPSEGPAPQRGSPCQRRATPRVPASSDAIRRVGEAGESGVQQTPVVRFRPQARPSSSRTGGVTASFFPRVGRRITSPARLPCRPLRHPAKAQAVMQVLVRAMLPPPVDAPMLPPQPSPQASPRRFRSPAHGLRAVPNMQGGSTALHPPVHRLDHRLAGPPPV